MLSVLTDAETKSLTVDPPAISASETGTLSSYVTPKTYIIEANENAPF